MMVEEFNEELYNRYDSEDNDSEEILPKKKHKKRSESKKKKSSLKKHRRTSSTDESSGEEMEDQRKGKQKHKGAEATSRSRSRDGRRKSGKRSADRIRSKERIRSRSYERRRHSRRTPTPPPKAKSPELTTDERDARTIFCMQLAARIRPRDLEDFFSSIGQVHDVRLILDSKSQRSKGVAYVEFRDLESVPLAIGLSGQRVLGVPIIIQPSHAEKNRVAMPVATFTKTASSNYSKLYVGSLHYNIEEPMIKAIFEPFGPIEEIKLIRDHQTGQSHGYCFMTFKHAVDAKKAMEQLNGFELAGRPIKISLVSDYLEHTTSFDVDEMDRQGFGMTLSGRIQLMAKLAEGTGMQIPAAAASVLNNPSVNAQFPHQQQLQNNNNTAAATQPPISTPCFILSNMFDPTSAKGMNWERELVDDILEECTKHGGIVHAYVDVASSQGNVYIKAVSAHAAASSVAVLHGRFFAGKQITASYVPLTNYDSLFPDSIRSAQPLTLSHPRP